MEDTGPTAFNPATDVDLTFSSFDLEDTERAPDTIAHTRFDDFYRGIEPANGDNADIGETTTDIRSHIDAFIRATPAEDGKSFSKVRNPLDLMNQVIASGEVLNFQDGRKYIADRIASGLAGTYNSRGNGAAIRFTDQAAVLENAALNDKIWIYPTLDWRYLPDGAEGGDVQEKVYRTIQYVSRSVDPEDESAQPELVSVLAGSRFGANDFVTLGYNAPEFATADYLSRTAGSIELRQDFVTDKTDTLFIKSPDKQVLDLSRHGVNEPADGSPDCLRVELDYSMQIVRIFSSDGEPSMIPAPTPDDPDKTENNPDYCSHQVDGDASISWATVAIPGRQ
ncbi:hypothetical protein [Marinobacter salinus]|nr:hypothetical protein [Marinobacter salinus]